jgi:teichuronic acid biosynthesis glycosyltransferase TuaG
VRSIDPDSGIGENHGLPRVSVIIPAHNAEPFLGEAIASVQAQSYADWELIVCDDGSQDRTWEILEAATGDRVTAVRNPSPTCPAVARNRALEQASGEFAVFLDADDQLEPRYLESQLAAYDRASSAAGPGDAEIGIVACDAHFLIGDQLSEYTYLDRIPDRGQPLTLERLLRRNMIFVTSLVPMLVGAEVGWFDAELFGTEDFGLWIKIFERGYRAVRNDVPLMIYRRTAGTVSSNLARQALNNRLAYELALARGRLNREQARIARHQIRYNRAMEEIAMARFSPGGMRRFLLRLPRILPSLAWVAIANYRMWPEWFRLLISGRAYDIARVHAET